MILLFLGLALIILSLVITLYTLHRSDTLEMEIKVTRPWEFSIKIKKNKPNNKLHKHIE